MSNEQAWPALQLKEWQATRDTLHMWTQVVGKVRMALSPHINHWWGVPLYVTARGLTTSPIRYRLGIFEIQFDFIQHKLDILTSNGATASILLFPRSVADFYADLMGNLDNLGVQPKFWRMPVEIPNPIPLDEDRTHDSYDPEFANRFWRILVSVDTVMKEFRSRFIGKNSPVHFFWGSFDLAVTRFSGRRAPERPGADQMTREAYSHEVSSVGFWPGTEGVSEAVFYSYFAPEPSSYSKSPVRPAAAFYSAQLNEFLLPYEFVRRSASPREALLDFFQSTYEAGANLGGWDRANLERPALSRPV